MAQPNRPYRGLDLANLIRRLISRRIQISQVLVIAAMLVGLAAVSEGQPPIIQPGAPGEPSREISAEDASNLTAIDYTDGDKAERVPAASMRLRDLENTLRIQAEMMRVRMERLAREQQC